MTGAVQYRSPSASALGAIIGDSPAIRMLRATIEDVAPTSLAVLIQGPTGAGKELVAAALHAESGRQGAFVPFNVCAISESMFEDALFGHVRGAFTGAVGDVPGFLREAHSGTVFLDEVSGLSSTMQAKLLRAIETGVFRPVGAKRDAQSDFRLITATNEGLATLVAEGRFRPDFVHRISAAVIHVPPLVDRLQDIALLVTHLLANAGKSHVRIDDEAIEELQAHDWPGNVRELKHVVEWCAAFSKGHLNAGMVRAAMSQRNGGTSVHAISTTTFRSAMRDALEQCSWNIDSAARMLGVHRATLYRRMKRLGLANPLRVVT